MNEQMPFSDVYPFPITHGFPTIIRSDNEPDALETER